MPFEHNGNVECDCTSESSCKKLGGTFTEATCQFMLNKCGSDCDVFKQAKDKGTCDGLKWMNGPPLKKVVAGISSICCDNFPKTLCNKEGKVTNPCAKDEDFTPDVVFAGQCKFSGDVPSEDVCLSKGCHPEPEGGCTCIDEEPCKKAGGTFKGFTCNEMGVMGEMSEHIEAAKKAGTCPNPLSFQIKFYAKRCCKNYPVSFCNPTGEVKTMCKDADFNPKAKYHSWCSVGKSVSEDECKAAGCDWLDECHCDSKEKCDKTKSFWQEVSCEQYVEYMDSGMLAKAIKEGKCDPGQSMEYAYPVSKCCTSGKSVCDR